MHELYEIRENLCKELKKYNSEEITSASLNVIDSLSHAIKNLDKIIEKYEEEENGNYGYNILDANYRPGKNRGSYSKGRGRNVKRDSMGRYASNGYYKNSDIINDLREMMMDAPDETTRQEFQKVISRLEMM